MKRFAHFLLVALLCLLTLNHPGSCQQECETPVELGFLVDQSGSINVENFEKVKNFILGVIAGFNASREGTHIGIIKYSTDATTVLRFNEFDDPNFDYENLNQTLQNALDLPSGGKTRIDLALRKADRDLFSGPSRYRTFVPKILLVLTDGQQTRGEGIPENNLFAATKSLSAKGVEVYVLGVGENVNIPEMLQIASDKDENVYLAEDFDDLAVQIGGLLESFCKVCRRDVDVAFLIPTAKHVGEKGLKDIKLVINALLSTFGIKKYGGVHVGFMTCAEVGEVVMNFDDYHNRKEIRNVLEAMKLKAMGKDTKLENCLKDASLNLFDVRGGVRNAVDKYLVVIGDGRASFIQQSVRTPLLSLKNQGVKVLSWARSSSQTAIARMKTISSDPKDIWFRQMQKREVENAGFFGRSISEIICKEKEGKCPYAEIPETCAGNDVFHECSSDRGTVSPCPGETKCCQVGCERQCLPPVPDCFNPVEIALLVDTSGTRGAVENENTLTELKEFAKELLHSFSITETSGRVALVTYSNESKIHKRFGSGHNFWNVEQKMKSLVLSNEADRNLAEALEFTRENVFSLKGDIRQSVPRVLVVLSTGRPTTTSSRLSQAARRLKDSGVQIWGVDAKGDSPSYMNEIVSQSSFFYPSLDELENFQDNFVSTVCSTKDGTCHSPLCSHDLQDECEDDYVCPGQQKCCSGPCKSCVEPKTDCRFPMDLAFIIQDSLDEREFEKVKNTMKGIMKALDVGRTQTWIGVITFNKKAEIKIEFLDNQGNSIEEKRKFLFDQIDKLQASPDRSTTGAEEAFKLAKNRLFTEKAGSHPGEIRSAVIISNDKFEEQEKLADASLALIWNIDNVLPVVITQDPHSVPFLESLASPDAEKHVYLATSYDALDQYRNRIAQDVCKEGKLKSEINSAIIVGENVAVRRKRRQAPDIGVGVKPVQGPVIMVKGPVGDSGPIGPKGIKGRAGLPGRKGATGEVGLSGEVGLPGLPGNSGAPGQLGLVGPAREVKIEYSGEKGPISDESSLRIAQMNLSKLDNTVYEYQKPKAGARGKRGSRGKLGSIGQDGKRGADGRTGFCGSEGFTGPPGHIGRIGSQGDRGFRGGRGLAGLPGPKGSSGNVGHIGIKGTQGPPGDPGEPGIKGENGEVGDRGKIGTYGDIGNPGAKGLKGLSGDNGEVGFGGFIGRQGINGMKGIPGIKGENGVVGRPGERGNNGGYGFRGQTGFPGIAGIPGLDGEDGEPGVKGISGAMGIRGKEGPLGKTGKPGVQGDHGLLGQPGHKGTKGLSGNKGVDGSDGEPGEVGRQGSSGDPGEIGQFGQAGIGGEDGEDGLPGRLGTEGSIGIQGRRGIEGEPGPRGDIGPVGRPGPPGPLNRPGLFGEPGITGEKGERGEAGFPGRYGKHGQKGLPGDIGEPGFPGSKGPTGAPGSDGNFGYHGTPGDAGLIGIPGSSGPNGQPGRVGQDGEAGPRGTPGKKGFAGPPGFPGPAGVAAPPGPIGLPGDPGERNKKGRKGSPGFPGSAGEDGPSGDKGETGSQGLPGTPGSQGTRGIRGVMGEEGDKGFSGSSGPLGSRGKIGPDGIKGSPGEPAMRGKSGVVGEPGTRGSKGVLGKKGEKGDMGLIGLPGSSGRPGNSGESGPAWLLTVDGVKGVKGLMGKVGNEGRPGTFGEIGQPGIQGNLGPLGMPGSQGVNGPIGLPGGVGLPGQKGPSGDPGDPGVAGVFGGAGLPGEEGLPGPQGDSGPKGTPGTGTLPGEPGSRGPKGFPGTIGISGDMGRKGRKGPKGSIGFGGDKGEKGTQGIVGTDGVGGLPGEPGTKGLKGLAGATGETGVVVQGDIRVPGRNGNIGKPGEDGDPGLPGKNGRQGMQGIAGARGSRGENGERGPIGEKGKIGSAGVHGEASAKGLKGPPGSPGLPGKSVEGKLGPPGPPGSAGIDGLPGLKGESGRAGPPGLNGFSGLRGANGTSGMIGDSVKTGSKGEKGEIGKPGNNATQGEKGEKGKIGFGGQGEKGDNGTVGLPGPDGVRGSKGVAVKGPMGLTGEPGKKGISGIQGPPGPPGPRGPHAISFNGTTISFRHNETHYGYIDTSLQNTTIGKHYYSLQLNMALYKRPNGTETFPSVTCADLYQNYPTLESGRYWIDPNGGAHEDAEQAYCDFANNATCLDPVRKKVKNKKWFTGLDGYKWFTEELDDAPDADKFNYAFDVVQLQMLQLQSNEAWQEITYHCLNSVAWSNTSSMFEHSIRLQGDDDLEFHSQMPRKLRPITIEDNCQNKDDQWNKTIIEVRSRNSIHLPIRDVAVYDVGDDGEEFGLELGRVCFTP